MEDGVSPGCCGRGFVGVCTVLCAEFLGCPGGVGLQKCVDCTFFMGA